MIHLPRLLFPALVLSLIAFGANAQTSINIHFASKPPNTDSNVLAPGDVAGFVPARHWNNSNGSPAGSMKSLVDSAGAPVAGLTVDYAAKRAAATDPHPSGGDEKLFAGYLAQLKSLTVSNIPYKTYDLYVYIAFEDKVDGSVQVVSKDGHPLTPVYYYAAFAGPDQPAGDLPGGYATGTSTDANAPERANYFVFKGLTAPDIALVVTNSKKGETSQVDMNWAASGVAGLQIVASSR